MTFLPCLVRSSTAAGEVRFELGHPLLDRYLGFVAGRTRPNTVRAVTFDLKTFFTVVDKDPRRGPSGRRVRLPRPTAATHLPEKIVLEPIFEADFSPVSFGFRPKRSAQQALEVVRQTANEGRGWVLDADIKACFDNIDHDALMAQVERRVIDRRC